MPRTTTTPRRRGVRRDGVRRQWGTERPRSPLPAVHLRPSTTKLILSRAAIWLTVLLWALYVFTVVVTLFLSGQFETPWQFIEGASYLLVVTFLTFSALMYLLARYGAYRRFREHRRAARAEIDRHFSTPHRPLTVLVPSYAEEPAVIRKTLWSAVLQEYPSLRVVLLLDDNPEPTDPAAIARLDETRLAVAQIKGDLDAPHERLVSALDLFDFDPEAVEALDDLIEEYRFAIDWLRDFAGEQPREDHVDGFFVDEVLLGLAEDLETTALALESARTEGATLPPERMRELLRRLVWIFSAEVTSFERKRYASLSHEANKAMNLNSYIGLLGGRFVEQHTPEGLMLRPARGGAHADLDVPYSDFVLTLDADSVLLRDYCLRLVHFLEQPANAQVAVTQTPYSSFRGAPTRIERLAGATTDVQHILHQGMTEYDATFWVGANAVIRMEALDDILEIETVGGIEVRRYVQDRTVIEDTESSVDLTVFGWKLVNYPERLSYSATPPDWGSLIVQRRRWANGGLLILPKMWRRVREMRRAHTPLSFGEVALRLNYMVSIAWASFGLIFLLVYPYDSRLVSPLILAGALPYFLAMASDLKYCGYKRSDIFRIYGFNLILLPVNLAGVLKSLQQGLTGKKIPFARTPKVKDRTSSPLLYVVSPYIIIGFSAFVAWRSWTDGAWGTLAFSLFNAICALWATIANIGVRNSLVDTWIGLTDWMYVDLVSAPRHSAPQPEPGDDWRTMLHEGHPAPGSTGSIALRKERTGSPYPSLSPTSSARTSEKRGEARPQKASTLR
ncbi:glycosyltransferase family 2 protein [uncultured Microbacterium sp.]|uniref:glycosyltransferase family 2 protein n=1 Tax=uncultured Microbacterium sp. TaxID=191216 RepID=UPI0025CBDCDC|nr:glycosyltransferase family 2 protein [uncultured Microbacterium sp.]